MRLLWGERERERDSLNEIKNIFTYIYENRKTN